MIGRRKKGEKKGEGKREGGGGGGGSICQKNCIYYGISDGKFKMYGSRFARQCPLVLLVKMAWAEIYTDRMVESGMF